VLQFSDIGFVVQKSTRKRVAWWKSNGWEKDPNRMLPIRSDLQEIFNAGRPDIQTSVFSMNSKKVKHRYVRLGES
jgi:hypothetical protein